MSRRTSKWIGLRVFLVSSAMALCGTVVGQSGGGYLITTVAGDGAAGFSGDDSAATVAQLCSPAGVAADANGNVFVADTCNNRIRKISATGIITTVVGNGVLGSGGDGGLATAAQLNGPSGVVVDAPGNLFIADTANQRIRKVSTSGIITTVAGTGTSGFGGDGGLATAAQLRLPQGVAVDGSGNLFIADTDNSRIRKVSTSGIITTVAGNSGFGGDGGLATAASLYIPYGVTVDGSGNMFIADTGNQRIRKVSAGGIITTVAGSESGLFCCDGEPATYAALYSPSGVAVDATGSLFITERGSQRIRKVSASGIITTIAGTGVRGFSGDGGPAFGSELDYPTGISIDAVGNLFATTGNRIRELISLPQLGVGCQYAIDQAQQAFTPAGASASVGILASASTCPWFVVSTVNWVSVSGSTVGSGTSLLNYSVAPNPNSASRAGTLWIAGKFLTVTQSGLTCALNLPSRNVSVAAAGITGPTMPVSFNAPDCSWNATTNVPWILLGSASSGSGSGAIAYTVGVNTGALRTGSIAIAGRTVYINQAGPGASSTSLASIPNGGVVNAASYAPLIAPGSFVAIYGQNLADAAASWDTAILGGKTLPTSLGGVQVQINGKKAFINYLASGQINVLAPPDSTAGLVDIDVVTNHGTATATVSIGAVSPAFFAYALQGKLYPVAFFANENVQVAGDGALAGAASRPATAGDYLTLYATGLGQTTPAYPVGQVITRAFPITDLSQVQVLFGTQPAKVLFAGMTFAGVFQINVQVPDGVPTGEVPVVLKIGTQSSAQTAVLPFQQ
jgi:uncharacterized protein (TIGR03437 family)